MRKALFTILARLNKLLIPSLWRKDLSRLNKLQLAIVAWRIWITKNALD